MKKTNKTLTHKQICAKGGRARRRILSPKRRVEIAILAARSRWGMQIDPNNFDKE